MKELKFARSIEINSKPDVIYKVITDIPRIPDFWHGTREINKIGENRYDVKFAFPSRAVSTFEFDRNSFIFIQNYIKGPFTGYTKNTIKYDGNKSILTTEWNIKLGPSLILFSRRLQGHFESGAENALKRIKEFVESNAGE
ncbi:MULTISPECIES: hypothetical protein [Acidiplasma]|uniref:Polyketide cyclase n=2 Tax=Acidiplasma TaxID=507753 RepID=A0A0Q0VXA2_9ARCH|nr:MULTISPECIES: hypothetical protein [Acidiplasma]KQB36291.1 hypothetical protein AOG54_07655 [Acidiplasma aeolicum]KQB36330.1 hypothetical protein AOG55_04355 [Acidiplasma cupricumulans]